MLESRNELKARITQLERERGELRNKEAADKGEPVDSRLMSRNELRLRLAQVEERNKELEQAAAAAKSSPSPATLRRVEQEARQVAVASKEARQAFLSMPMSKAKKLSADERAALYRGAVPGAERKAVRDKLESLDRADR